MADRRGSSAEVEHGIPPERSDARDRTPRNVVAQILDYGSWVSGLDRESVIEIANAHLPVAFETAFADVFGDSAPDELNAEIQLTIVATDLDPGSERVVVYLREFGVPINAVFFSYLEDDDRRYLARSWLVTREETSPARPRSKGGKRAEWNGRDWYVSFGEGPGSRSWEDGRRYQFVSAGGGRWHSGTLRSLPVGARVFVHVPSRRYVAVGTTLAEARCFDQAEVMVHGRWVPLVEEELDGIYRHGSVSDDDAEYVVPVQWAASVSVEETHWEAGMFANQNSACKLRQDFTLDRLAAHFDLDDPDA